MISFIVAIDENNLMANSNVKTGLPWHGEMPSDQEYYVSMLKNKIIVMGSKTYDKAISSVAKFRVVITRNPGEPKDGVVFVGSLEEALEYENETDELMVIGGGSIFAQMMDRCDRMYITFIHHSFEGDIYFPEYNKDEWGIVSEDKHKADQDNKYDYDFLVLDRKSK